MIHPRRAWALPALALTLVLAACSTPEDLTAPTLEPQFGTSSWDDGADMTFNKNGYLYVVGETLSKSYIRRYDRSGNMLWERTFNDGGYAYAIAVAADLSGNAYVGWYGYDDWVYKYDKNGVLKWKKYSQDVRDIATDSYGNVYVVGGGRGYVTKYNTNGSKLWERYGFPVVTGVAVSSSGNVHVVREDGAVLKYSSSGNKFWGVLDQLDSYDARRYKVAVGAYEEVFVVNEPFVTSEDASATYLRLYKFNKSGTKQWRRDVKYLSDSTYYRWYNIGITTDIYGNAYIAGTVPSDSSSLDGFFAKYNRSGSVVWNKQFGTYDEDFAMGIGTVNGSEVYVSGYTFGTLSHPNYGSADAFLRKMDKNGNRIWTR